MDTKILQVSEYSYLCHKWEANNKIKREKCADKQFPMFAQDRKLVR